MKLLIKTVVLLLIIFLVVSVYLLVQNKQLDSRCKGSKKCFTAIMKEIIDGDTFVIGYSKVRLALTNTPEKGSLGYEEAKAFVATLCPIGSKALVDQDDIQPYSYDRIVAVVYCNSKNLNVELLQNNLAVIEKQFCLMSEFGNEDWAKAYSC